MSAKPLRNSKGVNKPFRSPFANLRTPKNEQNVTTTPEATSSRPGPTTPLSKRLLFLQTPSPKKPRLDDGNASEEENAEGLEDLSRGDLEKLRERVQEKQKRVDELKTSLSYKKKNRAEDLEEEIEKWTRACQEALGDYREILRERQGESVSMGEILSSFSIDSTLVRFSVDDDSFY